MHIRTLQTTFAVTCLLSIHFAHADTISEDNQFAHVERYSIGGDGGWDLLALDKQHHRLFVSRTTHLQVIDTDSGRISGDIAGTEGVHGIALANDLKAGFTSNGKSNTVTVFDLTSLKTVDTIRIAGLNPDAIVYEPKSKHIFTFNGHSSSATVIDAVAHKEIDTISLPGKPELAVSDGNGKIFVNIEDKSEIDVIDGRTNKVLGSYALGKGIGPTGLAIDQQHGRLFSVCANNRMVILDSTTGKIISEVKIGAKPDSAAFDSNWGLAFSSNGDGTLTIVKEDDANHFSVMQNVITQKGARTMAYDQTSHRAYLVTASFGNTPPPTPEQPKPRPSIIPDSFVLLVVSLKH